VTAPYPDPRNEYQARKNYEFHAKRAKQWAFARNVLLVTLGIEAVYWLWRVLP